MKEIWKKIKLKKIRNVKPAKYYYVSNYGRVKNIDSGKILSFAIDKGGYVRYRLMGYKSDGEFGKISISGHVLVADTFKLVRNKDKYQINHIDGNKLNNSISNLEYVDQFENMTHRIVCLKQTKHPDEVIEKICQMLASKKYNQKEVSRILNIPYTTVSGIYKRRVRTHISDKYNW